MERIRKGNDIGILWEILTESGQPYDLTGKDLTLYLAYMYGKEKVEDFSVSGNILSWTYRGKSQKHTGVYSLILVENEGKDGMNTVDECGAFELVQRSCQEGGDAESHVKIETVSLKSAISLNSIVVDPELDKNSHNVVENAAIAGEFEVTNRRIDSAEAGIAQKQDKIEDLETIRKGAAKGATALQEHQDISGLATKIEVASKVDKAGYYPDLHVGTSDDLAGRGESVPAEFNFRASGGKSIKDGRAYIKTIKGNSVAWNQLVEGSNLKDGTRVIEGHKYFMEADFSKAPTATSISVYYKKDDVNTIAFSIFPYAPYVFATSPVSGVAPKEAWIHTYLGGEGYVTDLRLFDLTRMFGAGNEPTTLEELYQRIPGGIDIGAYNEGEVIHCNTERIKSVGDNLWDIDSAIRATVSDTTGVVSVGNIYNTIVSLIRCIPGQKYYCRNAIRYYHRACAHFFDINMKYIGRTGVSEHESESTASGEITAPLNAHYMYIGAWHETPEDCMVTLVHSGWKQDTDAGYQPYWADTLSLPIISKYFPDGMKSAGSAHDEIRRNKASGKWEKVVRISGVDLGDLSWQRSADTRFESKLSNAKAAASIIEAGSIICARYASASALNTDNGVVGISIDSDCKLWVTDPAYTDAASFAAAMQGVILYYELAEPVVTELDEADQSFRDYYNVADFGTEEAMSEVASAPFSADIIYQFNAVDMIREHEIEINELQAAIGAMQAQISSLTSN